MMLTRRLSSIYRLFSQNITKKSYYLLNHSTLYLHSKYSLKNICHELLLTFSLAIFLFYLFYQLFGNLILILFILIGIFSSLYSLQDALLYQPNEPDTSRTIVQTPNLFHLPYEILFIETIDHEKLHGFLIKQMEHAEQCETLIFFHGNAGNIGHRLQNACLLYRTCHINIVLFDYRGYGKSTGQPSESGLYLDAQAVYDYVCQRSDLNQEKIVLFGRSLGGAIALNLASYLTEMNTSPPLYAVIVENTFTSIADMAKRLFQIFFIDYIPILCYKNLYSSISVIRHIHVPILFISGAQDELVPPQMMTKLHDECRSSKKQLMIIPDGQHNTTWLAANYASQFRQFLSQCSIPSDSIPTTTTTTAMSNFN